MRQLKQILRVPVLLLLAAVVLGQSTLRAQPLLEESIANLYARCFFEDVGSSNPFSEAVAVARQSFAPGISGFIESNLSAIPLTPPSLEAEFTEEGIVNVVSGFTPIYTESNATVGKGLFLVGANASYFNLSKIRGRNLDELTFEFQQNGGGDRVLVSMPWDISAAVFTLHGTYGITNRFDIGFALPVVHLTIDNVNTTFQVVGDNTGCGYSPINCEGNGSTEASPPLFTPEDASSNEQTFLETLSLRAKYRFPMTVSTVRLAAVMDIRIPLRNSDNILGSGNFGTRFTFISEYNQLSTFQPYINVGGQFWNGLSSNSLNVAAGFNQQIASKVFFSFDMLGKVDLEPDPFLAPIGGALSPDGPATGSVLLSSSIPAEERDHTLNAGVGLQFAISPSFHFYASSLFALMDTGLQSTIAPTAGIAAHF